MWVREREEKVLAWWVGGRLGASPLNDRLPGPLERGPREGRECRGLWPMGASLGRLALRGIPGAFRSSGALKGEQEEGFLPTVPAVTAAPAPILAPVPRLSLRPREVVPGREARLVREGFGAASLRVREENFS